MPKILLMFALLLSTIGAQAKEAPKSGVTGKIVFLKGDFMPGPGPARGTTTPVARTIMFYAPARMNQVTADGYGGFYTKISTKLVGQTKSGTDGNFKMGLPPGTYTMVVSEKGKFYANGSDGTYLKPVVVKPNEFTNVLFNIDYESTW